MAQLLHPSASTMIRARAESQDSQEPIAVLARRHRVDPKTLTK